MKEGVYVHINLEGKILPPFLHSQNCQRRDMELEERGLGVRAVALPSVDCLVVSVS